MSRPAVPIEERFFRYVKRAPGCWVWEGRTERGGYGAFWVKTDAKPDGVPQRAHRVSYSIIHGREIPDGMVLDHMCRNRLCVNPDHLRVVTRAVNAVENSLGMGAINKLKTHCRRGHQYNEKNTIYHTVKSTGVVQRSCRICKAMLQKALRVGKKGALPSI